MNTTDLQPAPEQSDLAGSATATDAGGLTALEAAARMRRDGANVLPARRPAPLWRRVGSQLRDPLVLVLLAAAGFTLATADFTDASVILFVIVVNTTVGGDPSGQSGTGDLRPVRTHCPRRPRRPRRQAA